MSLIFLAAFFMSDFKVALPIFRRPCEAAVLAARTAGVAVPPVYATSRESNFHQVLCMPTKAGQAITQATIWPASYLLSEGANLTANFSR